MIWVEKNDVRRWYQGERQHPDGAWRSAHRGLPLAPGCSRNLHQGRSSAKCLRGRDRWWQRQLSTGNESPSDPPVLPIRFPPEKSPEKQIDAAQIRFPNPLRSLPERRSIKGSKFTSQRLRLGCCAAIFTDWINNNNSVITVLAINCFCD